MRLTTVLGWRLLLVLLGAVAAPLHGEEAASLPVSRQAIVGLIIDDLGDRLAEGERAIALPGAITYAILPQSPYSRHLAQIAHLSGKEVMVHQPMEAENGKALGPGGLTLHMTHREFLATLAANLESVPHARGLNNHMGSLLTRHPGHMAWLMEGLRKHGGLYFVDSTTTPFTVAQRLAVEYTLPNVRRNVFLDHDRDKSAIRGQFARFIDQAKSMGSAVAIGHPYPETLAVLEELLPTLQKQGVRLLPISALIAQRNERRERLWQASLSPSPKGVKSSKQ